MLEIPSEAERHNWPAATGIHQFGIFKLVPEACIA